MAMIGLCFGYWLVLLLALEPGNIQSAAQAHLTLGWGQEAVRILGASLLGAATAPLLMAQIRRFPIVGADRLRHAALQLVAAVAMAAGLIVVSCLCARVALLAERRPLLVAMGQELLENWALVTVWVALSAALGHGFLGAPLRHGGDSPQGHEAESPQAAEAEAVTVRSRGLAHRVGLDAVEWLESQGNYVALHVGTRTHLIRDQLMRLEARLPRRFVRIHRRTIVAVDQVAELVSLGSGDGLVRLRDGTELRLSRTYRTAFEAAVRGDGAGVRGI